MNRIPNLLLRIAIAGAFLYPAIASLMTPQAWIGYFPHFVIGVVPDMVLLGAWSVIEAVIALWILSGTRIFLPSLVAGLMLCGIVLFNIPLMDIVFRDIALALVAFSLALTARSGAPA